MKSRSEVMKTRSQAAAEKKTSAAERTVPLPAADVSNVKVTCEACDTELLLGKLEKRADGDYECSECAAPIKVSKTKVDKLFNGDDTDAGVVAGDEDEERAAIQEEAKPKKKDGARSGVFCGECGAEWPVLNGEPTNNCGHKAKGVDDPAKATKPKAVTASGVSTPKGTATMRIQGEPVVTISGTRVSVAWGKVVFPVGEPRGYKFSNMDIGSHIIARELAPGEDLRQVVAAMIADLRWIADLAFETQFSWYKEKLGIIDK